MKRFYTHIVKIESLIIELDQMDFDEDEKVHLAHLIDGTFHHTILEEIFSHLSETERLELLKHLEEDDHNKIWKFLNSRVDNVEEKIIRVAEELKKELHEDLKESKQVKEKE
jgi:hypothetical protein